MTLEKSFILEYRRKNGRSPWQCKYCNVIIKDSNKPNHIETNKHNMNKKIYKLSKSTKKE